MTLEEFKLKVTILDDSSQSELRSKYIAKFINTNHEWYHEYIEETKLCVDGECYTGYLWDFLKNPALISMDEIKGVGKSLGEVYVFWDIHSCERIHIPNYWKFGKNTALKLSFSDLLNGLRFLPEDIYICNKGLEWTLVLTHEDIDGVPYYLKSGNIKREE